MARNRPSGSYSRPERFNLRLDTQTWARTMILFEKVRRDRGLECKADVWEAVILPFLERAAAQIPRPRPTEGERQMRLAL